jgi:hypothetical protein
MNGMQQTAAYRRPVIQTTPIPLPRMLESGPDPDWPGFPLKTCGNDDLRIGHREDAAAAGNETPSDSKCSWYEWTTSIP